MKTKKYDYTPWNELKNTDFLNVLNYTTELDLNNHESIDYLSHLLRWRLYKDEAGYCKFILQGDCTLHSYSRGVYELICFITLSYPHNNLYSVRIWYDTIDDGNFGGWLNNLTLDQAKYILGEVIKIYSKYNQLPMNEQINKDLEHLGIIVDYEI